MNKINLKMVLFAGLIASSSLLNAAAYKGQNIYTDTCKQCHGGGQEYAGSKRIKAWEKTMEDIEKVSEKHLKSKKAADSVPYFENKKQWKKDSKHIQDFLIEYAKDSGNVPACD